MLKSTETEKIAKYSSFWKQLQKSQEFGWFVVAFGLILKQLHTCRL